MVCAGTMFRGGKAGVWAGAGVTALGGAALYGATLAPGLGGTIDSAEFQHAAATLSIVHPTGYPMFLLVAHAWITALPFGEVAWRVNLLSAVCALLALLVVYATVVDLGGGVAGGMLAAGLTATHPLVWQTAVVAEVNSLNVLLVVATLGALFRWGVHRRWPLEIAALLYGLALGHHRTSLLLAPAIMVFVVAVVRRGVPLGGTTVARCLTLLVLPMAFYLYIPWRAATTPWYTNTWANFTAELGGASAWPVILDTIRRPLAPRMGLVIRETFPGFVGALTLLAALAAGATAWRLPAGHDRLRGLARPVVALYSLGAVTIAAVMMIYDVAVIGDYLALIVPLAATAAGLGLGRLLDTLPPLWAPARGRAAIRPLLLALAALLPLAQGAANYRANDFSGYTAPRDFWREVAAGDGTRGTLVPQAILLGNWARTNELRYRQTVEGWRPDLVPVVLDDLLAEKRLGLIDEWLSGQRGVYLTEEAPDVTEHFLTLPQGRLARITARGEAPSVALQHPLDIRFGGEIHLLGYTLEPVQPRPGNSLRITLFWQTRNRLTERYVVFTHLVDATGRKIGQRDDEPGRGFRPTINWAPGQIVTDTLLLPVATDATPGTYHLKVGLYAREGERRLPAARAGGEALGDYWEMTAVDVGP
ncbi:MAG TPA: DUF2723 domain-containing protein [Chloroflexia bacterium]|nr:DUF2723 domain-containing protein [Chloroflexia bacterium]